MVVMYQSFGPLGALVLALGILGYIVQSRLPPPKPKVIGIDLGTTYSCVAVYNAVHGNVTVLEDDDGSRVIPSVVAFVDDRVLVGYPATKQAEQNPTRTIYDSKRFIGKSYANDQLDSFSKMAEHYPFVIQIDRAGNPVFHVRRKSDQEITLKGPDDIGALILKTLKRTAEKQLDQKITKAVVSVPAEFSEEQRQATILAGRKAGLEILRVINEPTAAAMAYGMHKRTSLSTIVVIDFGGGTLDVSLLSVQGGMFVTMAMAGNNRLGGQDINENMLDYFLEKLAERDCILTEAEDLQHLRDEVENAKLKLTEAEYAKVTVTVRNIKQCNLGPREKSIVLDISRSQFEDLNKGIFEKILVPIRRVIREAGIHIENVDEIILVGGSTRIPKVRKLVKEFFNKQPNVDIDPDVAVVTGVAVQAGILGGAWPLQVAAIEIPRRDIKKIDVSKDD